jgi:hypothetical protein
MKRLLEGKSISCDTKYSFRTVMKFRGTIVIVSNESSPSTYEPAFERSDI